MSLSQSHSVAPLKSDLSPFLAFVLRRRHCCCLCQTEIIKMLHKNIFYVTPQRRRRVFNFRLRHLASSGKNNNKMGNEIKQVSCSVGTATLAQKIDRVALERVYGLAIMYKTQKKKENIKIALRVLKVYLKEMYVREC